MFHMTGRLAVCWLVLLATAVAAREPYGSAAAVMEDDSEVRLHVAPESGGRPEESATLWEPIPAPGDERPVSFSQEDGLEAPAPYGGSQTPPPYGENRFSLPYDASGTEPWAFHLLPEGLIYRSYLAGVKEPRFGAVWNHEKNLGWIWDVALGGRVGILRYGTAESDRPEGWQLDLEGAAFPRLDIENDRDVVSTDFRAGVPLTFGWGRFQTKLAYYHICSHLADEYMIRYPGATRINYVRDAIVLGGSYFLTDDVRLYGEAGWSFWTDGGAKPWEFQFGAEYSPRAPRGKRGSPFAAVGGHLREDFDFGGSVTAQLGWQWRGKAGDLFRIGVQYFQGKSDQFEFLAASEEKIGLGIWYDY